MHLLLDTTKILIVNAVKEVKQDKNIAFLETNHIEKIYHSYLDFKDVDDFSKVVTNDEVIASKGSLNIAQYVSNVSTTEEKLSLTEAITNWNQQSIELEKSMQELFQILN